MYTHRTDLEVTYSGFHTGKGDIRLNNKFELCVGIDHRAMILWLSRIYGVCCYLLYQVTELCLGEETAQGADDGPNLSAIDNSGIRVSEGVSGR